MREWSKLHIANIEDPKVMRANLQAVDGQLYELSKAVSRLASGYGASVTVTASSGGGVTDHGLLSGLGDDDHSQYLLLANRTGGQTISVSANPISLWSTSSNELALKIGYSTTTAGYFTTDGYLYMPGFSNGSAVYSPYYIHLDGDNATTNQIIGGNFYIYSYNNAVSSSLPAYEFGMETATSRTMPMAVWTAGTAQIAALSTGGIFTARGLTLASTATGTVAITPSTATVSYSLTMPTTQASAASLFLQNDGSGALSWASAGGGLQATANENITGLWTFNDQLTIDATSTDLPLILIGSGGDATFDTSALTGAGRTYTLPDGSGTLVMTNASQTLGNKTLATNCKLLCNTSAGVTFQDNSSTTKQMRLNLSGITAGTTRALATTDTSGTLVVVGNTTSSAGVLGASSLTAQTASIGSTTLLTGGTSTAGMYRISAYFRTSTAGSGGDTVKLTAAWNDGASQTMDLPILTTGGAATTHDLATLNAHSQGSIVVYSAASQNITFTTTVSKTGSPQYSLYVRIEAL